MPRQMPRTILLVTFVLVLAALAPEPAMAVSPRQRNRIAKVQKLYNLLLGTGPHDVGSNLVSVADIFDENVKGRVTPLGRFEGFEGTREYFFGLLVAPGVSATHVELKSAIAYGDQVAIKADVTVDMTGTLGRVVVLRETGFFRFNKRNKIISYDLAILNLGAAVDPRSDFEKDLRMQGVCALASAYCPAEWDGDTGAAKFAACRSFMGTKPYGSWNRANSDTFTCRELHVLLTALRPEVHCAHVGKTGGETCVDEPYESFFDFEY